MNLEKHLNKERVDIKKLTLEEPEREPGASFDPERDITDKDWEEMKENIEEHREDGWTFPIKAKDMKLANPDRFKEIKITKKDWQVMKNKLEEYREKSAWADVALQAARMKIINPSEAEDLNINERAWERMKAGLEKEFIGWWDFVYQASAMKIINPERFKEIEINTVRRLEAFKQNWENVKKKLEKYDGDKDLRIVLWPILGMRILKPDKFKEIKVDPQVWRMLREQLERLRREESWDAFSDLAAEMTVLTAEKLEVTDKGLEITMPKKKKSHKEKIPPIPKKRKF